MEPNILSSNWKSLQKSLSSSTAPKKRKSSTDTAPTAPRKRYKQGKQMGALFSKVDTKSLDTVQPGAPSTSLSKSRSSTSLPSTLKYPTVHQPSDVPNTGLTPGIVPGKYVAIDCEMVGVGPNPDEESALARVSAVDFQGRQIYDSFVTPKEPVTDYRTHVSGITLQCLKEARTLEQVQKDIAELLKDRVLVGHAVRNDLDALMLGHPRKDTRDTSRYPKFRAMAGGRSPALRKLAKIILGLDIQSGEHSSVEDARATMALFRQEKDGFEAEHMKTFGGSRGKNSAIDHDGEEQHAEHDRDDRGRKPRVASGRKKKKKKGKK